MLYIVLSITHIWIFKRFNHLYIRDNLNLAITHYAKCDVNLFALHIKKTEYLTKKARKQKCAKEVALQF
jgi:hypothetical protein